MFGLIIAGIIVLFVVVIFVSGYVKAPTNEAYIISGIKKD